MAVKSSDQVTIIDLTDGYTVNLSQDAVTFNGQTDKLGTAQNVTVNITAFQGKTQVLPAVTQSEITNPDPNNISVLVQTPDSSTPNVLPIKFTFGVNLASSGVISIPVKLESGAITIVKAFTYSIAFKGLGGTSITISSIKYQQGSSNTTAPTGTWSDNPVSVSAGKYLWTKTTYSDNSVAYSVARQGSNGTSVTISSTQYQAGTSNTQAPSGTWSNTPVSVPEGQYLWTKVTYSDNTVAYSVARQGVDTITLVITSSEGFIFKNSQIATTLTAHVYKGGQELTGNDIPGTIKWYLNGSSTASGTGSTYSIGAGDVSNKVDIEARLETT